MVIFLKQLYSFSINKIIYSFIFIHLIRLDKDEASQVTQILKVNTLQAKDKHQEEELHQTSKS
jgi:hypothetical protein